MRIISVHLLDAAGQLLRVLYLYREGHISAEPHYLPREQALIQAANQQRVLACQADVLVLCASEGRRPASGFRVSPHHPWAWASWGSIDTSLPSERVDAAGSSARRLTASA